MPIKMKSYCCCLFSWIDRYIISSSSFYVNNYSLDVNFGEFLFQQLCWKFTSCVNEIFCYTIEKLKIKVEQEYKILFVNLNGVWFF